MGLGDKLAQLFRRDIYESSVYSGPFEAKAKVIRKELMEIPPADLYNPRFVSALPYVLYAVLEFKTNIPGRDDIVMSKMSPAYAFNWIEVGQDVELSYKIREVSRLKRQAPSGSAPGSEPVLVSRNIEYVIENVRAAKSDAD